MEDHKPVAGCRITFPKKKTGKIERVCVVREKQKSGYGRILIQEAENWLKEFGVKHIVISSQDRAAGFYEKLGYKLNPSVSPTEYEKHKKTFPWLYLHTCGEISVTNKFTMKVLDGSHE